MYLSSVENLALPALPPPAFHSLYPLFWPFTSTSNSSLSSQSPIQHHVYTHVHVQACSLDMCGITDSIVYCCTEYIVTFTSYYTTEARDGYLSATLQSFTGWSIVPRLNPSREYPSDFSLLRIFETSDNHSKAILDSLNRHPLIKRVTPQRRLTRLLNFVDERMWLLMCSDFSNTWIYTYIVYTLFWDGPTRWQIMCRYIFCRFRIQ